jgi:hypothetical protein
MAELGNITAANATLVMVAETVIPAGVPLSQFSTDQSFSMDEVTSVEDRMGVDGHLAAGWVPSVKAVTVNLEATSPSVAYMNLLYSMMEKNRTIYKVTLIATVPSIRKIYTWTGGVLKSGTPVANAKKVLDPTSWKFDFANLNVTSF